MTEERFWATDEYAGNSLPYHPISSNQAWACVFDMKPVVTIHCDGCIAESSPLQINTVYAITLTELADWAQRNKG
ncbi:hypothetical protein [Pseudoflavonifractor sp. An44]|uniref:hypothetical protein n=1 Tax=Pseudoflavonifractor sp. An44 TaxID=1965635 RepID=UPI001179EE04|nr:hypothetical protein [Pseudoflavonifractor sp. An44]